MTTTARHYRKGRQRNGVGPQLTPRLGVMHAMQAPEKGTTAESCASYFRTTNRVASAHWCFDNNSGVQVVDDEDTAYGASGANADGMQYELAGYSEQTPAEWDDAFSVAMLVIAAVEVGRDCVAFGWPVRRLTVEQVRDGVSKGLTDHATVEKAFPSTGHTDPGPNFPWPRFLELVQAEVDRLTNPTTEDDEVGFYIAADPRPAPYKGSQYAVSGDMTRCVQLGAVADVENLSKAKGYLGRIVLSAKSLVALGAPK